MPLVIVPTPPSPIVTSLSTPLDGELANAASITQYVQPLANCVEGFKQAAWGGGLRRRVTALNATNVDIYPLGNVMLLIGGVWYVYKHQTITNINPTMLSGGLLAGTRYWIYAYSAAGVLSFQVTTASPDGGLRYKAGDEGYAYVSTFWVNPAGTFVPYCQVDNDYTLSATASRVLTGGAAIVNTGINVNIVPPQARRLRYRATVALGLFGWYADVGDSSLLEMNRFVCNGSLPWSSEGSFCLQAFPVSGTTGAFSYLCNNAAVSLDLDITGFTT